MKQEEREYRSYSRCKEVGEGKLKGNSWKILLWKVYKD